MAKAQIKYIDLRQERDFGEILNATFDFTMVNFGNFFRVIFTITGPVLIGATLMMTYFGYGIFSRFLFLKNMGKLNLMGNVISGNEWGLLALSILVIVVGFLLLYMTVYGYLFVYNERKDPDVSTIEVWHFVRRNFFRYLGSGFVLILFFIFTVILVSLLFVSGISFFIILGFLGICALVVFQSIFFAILTFEGFNPVNSIVRGFNLVWGNWWFTLGIFMIFGLLSFVLNTAIQSGATLLMTILNLNSSDSSPGFLTRIFTISTAVLAGIGYVLMQSIGVVKNALVYFSFSEAKDSLGLMEKLEQISGTHSQAPTISVEKSKSQYSSEDAEEDY